MIKKAAFIYPLTMGLYVSLALALLAETWWLNPPPGSRLVITAIQLIPLTLPLYGLLKTQSKIGRMAVLYSVFLLYQWGFIGFSPARVVTWLADSRHQLSSF